MCSCIYALFYRETFMVGLVTLLALKKDNFSKLEILVTDVIIKRRQQAVVQNDQI